MSERKVIFVYNTERGLFKGIAEYTRRTFSPDAHECKLRVVTHGVFGIKGSWKKFVRKLDVPMEFLQRDEVPLKYPKALYKHYPKTISYPCVLVRTKDSVEVLITSDEIVKCSSVEELIDLVTQKVMSLPK